MQLFFDELNKMTLGEEVNRLFHGRGGLYPGAEHICLDWYPPVLLLTSFKPLEPDALDKSVELIKQRWQALKGNEALNLVYQYRSGGRTQTDLIEGSVPDKHAVLENGAQYHVHLLKGQNHGLFLDMKNGRQWVREHAQGKKVLNLFSYTCAFSVAALQGGCDSVVNIDMSKGALSIGKQNHLLNGFTAGARFFGHDIFKSWGKLTKLGPYEMIIADPPSNQKGSFVATKDYSRLLKRLPELLTEDGEVLLCLNAPELTIDFLMQQVEEFSPSLEFVEQLANPSIFADISKDKALKVLKYRRKNS
ncbi:class I SAM-dependent methyltransferase [Shewanella sp.]|uniref:class I SAM-dependent methyltransferase n=1 Tax=Shewanella sp. TaxID=50422 RepID=UPI001A4016BF|nr:class I SAM-dependent methyltransferase [Shewanella sp.]MBL4815786.1 class I SAM-dependent methyltransferase [Shewanella sp.]MCJ8302672.1 class I SAM-dependent methyltransferase [Shewanella sp.]